jgi:hypothetical protein
VKYKSDLQQDSGLRERFFLSMREYRETQVHDPRQIAECRECLRRLPRSAT